LTTDFESKYHKVLKALDSLSNGTFHEDDASSLAAFCLITQAALNAELSSAEFKVRAIKRDIDFAKAEAYIKLKSDKKEGKRMTEVELSQLLVLDPEVQKLSKEQNTAEKDAKDLATIYALLKEAHLTFRSIKKGV
jgi:hypothetical protein